LKRTIRREENFRWDFSNIPKLAIIPTPEQLHPLPKESVGVRGNGA
jgi:hypothetical protein